MIESLPLRAKYLIYDALVQCVQSASGVGFHNGDQGHIAYLLGMESKVDHKMWGDSPEENMMFQLMRELSMYFVKHEQDRPSNAPLVLTWEDFCQMAVTGHEAKKKKA